MYLGEYGDAASPSTGAVRSKPGHSLCHRATARCGTRPKGLVMERRIASARVRAAGTALAWPGALVLLVTLPQASALAEVCDKVAGQWGSADAPTGFLGPVAVAGLVLACGLSWFTRSLWIATAGAAAFLLLAVLAVSDMWLDHATYRSAVLEGCRSRARDGFEAFVFLAGAGLILICGRMRRSTAV
ncbi:hypothetical protein [Xanthobacter sp. YC-JY1]|uniref:hypothetical protein n=1 Tax=Xanthobacter sp. YC-JY1 TaxID=2419844 RepID=UPI001F17747A|nr:hypothetical protein [Xanthobacter sp. YC-JY1]